MYYEEAEVKEYKSINKQNGTERTKFQINLNKKSKFREPKKIALVDIDEIKEIASSLDDNNLNELEDNLKQYEENNIELNKEIDKYNEQVHELEETAKSLASDVHKLKEEKLQLQNDLIKLEENMKVKNEEIIELQKQHKEEISELHFKLNNEKDLTKSLLVVRSDLLNRNALDRLRNKEPESSKRIAQLKEIPEEVEVKPSDD